MAEFHLRGPLKDEDVAALTVGDLVYFSGEGFTCRSALQRYVFNQGHALPFATAARNVLIHVGPVILKEEGAWSLKAFTPTSSVRFEKWGPRSIREWGLKAIVGKTTMGAGTMRAMKEHRCVHVAPVGVTPNRFVEQVQIQDVHWYDELGSIEAAWLVKLTDFGPFLVDIDCHGRNYFEELDTVLAANREEAYRRLGIPSDFEYTRLY